MQWVHGEVNSLVSWASHSGSRDRYPGTCAAIETLKRTLESELHRADRALTIRMKIRHRTNEAAKKKEAPKHRTARCRLKRKLATVSACLEALKKKKQETTKTVGGRISQDCILRVILGWTNASGHAWRDTCQKSLLEDCEQGISRSTISFIQAAFLSFLKEMKSSVISRFIGAHLNGHSSSQPTAAPSIETLKRTLKSELHRTDRALTIRKKFWQRTREAAKNRTARCRLKRKFAKVSADLAALKKKKTGNNQDCGGSHIPGLHLARDSWLDKCKRARVEGHLSKISIRGL